MREIVNVILAILLCMCIFYLYSINARVSYIEIALRDTLYTIETEVKLNNRTTDDMYALIYNMHGTVMQLDNTLWTLNGRKRVKR